MKRGFVKKLNTATCIIIVLLFSCNKYPYKLDYKHTGGYVIAKETCKTSGLDEYWLIDLTYYQNTPEYGDTLILNGNTYTNVVKVKSLDLRLQQIGMTVAFDFKTITPDKVQTTGCIVANPITYNLKELFIINQFEIR